MNSHRQPFGPPGYGRRHGRERQAEQIGEPQPIQGRRAKTHCSNFREGGGSVLQGLAAICHEAGNGGYIGSHCPKQSYVFSLLGGEGMSR